jgi:hypothetical protein
MDRIYRIDKIDRVKAAMANSVLLANQLREGRRYYTVKTRALFNLDGE